MSKYSLSLAHQFTLVEGNDKALNFSFLAGEHQGPDSLIQWLLLLNGVALACECIYSKTSLQETLLIQETCLQDTLLLRAIFLDP